MLESMSFGAAITSLCASLLAQPEAANLGTLGVPHLSARTGEVAARTVTWYRFVLPQIAEPTTWLDISTSAGPAPTLADTELALYSSTGEQVRYDDDDGPGSYSALSFGIQSPTRPQVGGGLAFNGRDGGLAAGVYYLGVSAYRAAFAQSNWAYQSVTNNAGSFSLRIELGCSLCPTPITCGAAFDAPRLSHGSMARLLVQVTPGTQPPSEQIAVTADLRALGGPAAATLRDDGLEGDDFAGDLVFTVSIEVSDGLPLGSVSVPVLATDDLGRTAAATASATIAPAIEWMEHAQGGGDAGDWIAQPVTGSGALTAISGELTEVDADMFLIRVTDPAAFSARAEAISLGTNADPQLHLIDACTRSGIVANDDEVGTASLAARLGGSLLSRPGMYYLAVSRTGSGPYGLSGGLLWGAPLLRSERPPDGSEPMAGWHLTSGARFHYLVTLTGCQRVSEGADPCAALGCPADFDSSGQVDADDLAEFINCFFAVCARGDFDRSGGVDGDDLAEFINAFFQPVGPC